MSGGAERYLDYPEAEAIGRLRSDLPQGIAAVSAWFEVLFPLATTRRDVQHGLGVIPTGYQLIAEEGGSVRAFELSTWTPDLAFLQATANNTRARLRFLVTSEDPIDA